MLPRANDDSAARLLLAEHAEERGDGRMARAWRWMACMAKWPDFDGWWPRGHLGSRECHRLPISRTDDNRWIWMPVWNRASEQIIADALERGDL